MDYTSSDLKNILRCEFIGNKLESILINHISIDSRYSYHNSHSLFFAIKGQNDGHHYIQELIKKGVRNFVISDRSFAQDSSSNFYLVENTTVALQKLAQHHRAQFNIPIIGITGSNGKTTVKEWLSESLSSKYNIAKTPGSFNSQFGVPLSVLQLNSNHNLGIFEAGISQSGEMENLENIIKPTIGILTNIGSAHDYGFNSRDQKINEKLTLFQDCDIVICQDENRKLFHSNQKIFTWGNNGDLSLKAEKDSIYLKYQDKEKTIRFDNREKSNTENMGHIIAFHVYQNQSLKGIDSIIDRIPQIKMRLEVVEGINNMTLIDDSYNNDPEGLIRAINFLKQQEKEKPKAIILSGFEQLKHDYSSLINTLRNQEINPIITIGPELRGYSTSHFHTVDSFLTNHDISTLSNHVVLIKGARKYNFEQITETLQKEFHETKLEVDLSALQHNYNFFKSTLKSSTKIMVMVKAYAYGSGNLPIARLMEFNNVDYLGVAYIDEGIELRKNGITTPIMVMNPTISATKQFLEYNLEPEIYSLNQLKSFVKKIDRQIGIHIKIDTGMHRLGFNQEDIPELCQIVKSESNIKIKSIFSHLATADSEDDRFANHQISIFEKTAGLISEEIGYRPLWHILNSSGIQNHNEFQFDMVRLGIGLYGIGSEKNHAQLKHISKLTTNISQIRRVNPGDTVGYSQMGKINKPSLIATIAIGYADGYDRRFGNGIGKVLVNNQIAPVIGNVCMDMTMIDVTNIEVNEGDEVTIFSQDLSISKLANSINTIPYEMLTSISERVKRVFVKN